MAKDIILSVDFDGTVVTPEFPKVGHPVGAEPVLKALSALNCKIILWTVRSDKDSPDSPQNVSFTGEQLETNVLTDAVNWFKERNIPLYGINNNPDQQWSSSPKAYATDIIDDYCVGIPLVETPFGPVVDWVQVYSLIALKYNFAVDPTVIAASLEELTKTLNA